MRKLLNTSVFHNCCIILFPYLKYTLEKGRVTHSSIMVWRIPWTVQSMGLQRVIDDWVNYTFTQNTRFPICSHSHLCIYSQNNWNQDLKEINSFLVFHQEMIGSVQFSSVTQLCLTLCDPINPSMLGLPVHHQLPEFTQTHAHRVGDAIQPSHPLLSLSPPAPNPSQHQGLFQWVNFSHEVTKILEFQLQHQSFQWIPRIYLL